MPDAGNEVHMYCYRKLPYMSIVPGGVIKSELRAQLDGLTGNIDKLFPDLDMNNAWLGGTGEAWERGPYYLSGLIPLAFLTKDAWAMERVALWVEAILKSQQSDGNFGPVRNYDWWPRMVVLKAFCGYFEATGDMRILDFMERYFRFQYENIDRQPLYFWASARAFESMEAIDLVYQYRPQAFLKELVEKLAVYSYNFFDLFDHFPYTGPMTEYISRPLFKLGKELAEILDSHSKRSTKSKPSPDRESILKFNRGKTVSLIMKTHGVNLAMALKYPATYGAFTGRPDLAELCKKGYGQLYRSHGNCTGLFSSDEHLMGTSPTQGIELCTVVEMMYSLEEIGRVTGEAWVFELLESLAYNVLPAMFTPDMRAHQYVQQPNQAVCSKARRQFFDTDSYANTFGIAPNYGCCAANMHAGFPLFAGYLALRHEEGLTFPVYGDCTVTTTWDGQPLVIKETSNYPFDDRIRFDVVKAGGQIELQFRRISNTDFAVYQNGEVIDDSCVTSCGRSASPETGSAGSIDQLSGEVARPALENMIRIAAREGDRIEIHCHPKCNTVTNPDGSKSIRYGNLLMAFGLPAREIYIKGTRPFHDRGFISTEKYNKTPFIDGDQVIIEDIINCPVSALPFSEAPVKLIVKGRYVEGCRMKKHSAGLPLPLAYALGEETSLTLVPYGTTRLRISQFPASGNPGEPQTGRSVQQPG